MATSWQHFSRYYSKWSRCWHLKRNDLSIFCCRGAVNIQANIYRSGKKKRFHFVVIFATSDVGIVKRMFRRELTARLNLKSYFFLNTVFKFGSGCFVPKCQNRSTMVTPCKILNKPKVPILPSLAHPSEKFIGYPGCHPSSVLFYFWRAYSSGMLFI